MGNSNKIVDLSTKKSALFSSENKTKLSRLLEDVLSLYNEQLKKRVEALFVEVDDHLFDKSGKSDDARHFSALRTLRLEKGRVCAAFEETIRSQFIDAIGKVPESSFLNSSDGELSFESLALVEKEALEERIALDSMSNKAQKLNAVALNNICLRLDAMAPSKTVSEETNPFDPSCVNQAFSQALGKLEISMEFKLVLYKFFERKVIDELELIYDKINQYFIEEGILPDLKTVPVRTRNKSASERKEKSVRETYVASDSDEGGTEHENKTNGELRAQSSDFQNQEVLNLLGELLTHRRGTSSNTVQQKVNTDDLVNVLSNLQHQSVSANENNLKDIRSQIGTLLPQEVASAVNHGALGQANDDMIDVVTMLFDFILDDENLHSEIKALIGRLQIPILKVGLTDKTFFSNRKHPARLLLNELARAGLSWEPNDPSSKPMLQKIQITVEKISNEYANQDGFFDDLLEDFVQFKNEFKRKATIFEKRTKEAEEGKAKAESARSKVNLEIKKICNQKKVPTIAKQIFKNVWSHVMFLESLRDSTDGWDNVVKLGRMLVWSVQPVREQARLDKLVKIVPILIKNLKLGFNKISYSQIDASRLLDQLEECHREIIVEAKAFIEEDKKDEIIRLKPRDFLQAQEVAEVIEVNNQVEEVDEEVSIDELAFSPEEVGMSARTDKSSIAISDKSRSDVQNFSAGCWFDLKIESEFRRCKLAARIVSTGKYIFVNRSGVKVAEFYTDEIAAAYQMGEVKVLDDEALFDRALKAVISNLRDMKAET